MKFYFKIQFHIKMDFYFISKTAKKSAPVLKYTPKLRRTKSYED